MAEFDLVDPPRWRSAIAEARDRGFDFLAHLTAVDELGRLDAIRVLAWLDNIDTGEQWHLATLVPRTSGVLDSIADILPAAAWLERQVHDFFGVTFNGADNRALLHHGSGAPLLKDVLLEPRLASSWPGALEPGESDASPSRRRVSPPGVPDAAVLADPDVTPEEIALSASGVRTRRAR